MILHIKTICPKCYGEEKKDCVRCLGEGEVDIWVHSVIDYEEQED